MSSDDVTAVRLRAAPQPTLPRQPEEEQKGGVVTQKAGGSDGRGCGRMDSQEPVHVEMEVVQPRPSRPGREPGPASKDCQLPGGLAAAGRLWLEASGDPGGRAVE